MSRPTCPKCDESIKKESEGITCDGGCGQVLHLLCSEISEREKSLIQKNDNIQFLCDTCKSFSLKAISNIMNGIFGYMKVMDERQSEMSKTLEEMKESNKREREVKRQTADKQAEKEQTVKAVEVEKKKDSKTPVSTQIGRENNDKNSKANASKQNTQLKQVRAAQPTKHAAHMHSQATPKSSKASKPDTERKKTKQKKGEKNKRDDNTKTRADYAVVVRPKQTQNSSETIKQLNRKCEISDLELANVIKTKSGSVIIYCQSSEQQEEVKKSIEKTIGNEYEVDLRSPLSPKIKIYGITEEMEKSEIEALLKRQNGFIAQGDIEVLKVVKDWKEKDTFNAIVQVDATSFDRLMEKKKVLLNWDSCAVKEHLSIVRCHKCSGFNHKKEDCRNEQACGYCSKSHESTCCDAETYACINCIVANEKYALNLDTNHHVWSAKCDILKKKLERVSKRTSYDE